MAQYFTKLNPKRIVYTCQETAVKPPEDMPEVVDDFDIGEDEEVAVENRLVEC